MDMCHFFRSVALGSHFMDEKHLGSEQSSDLNPGLGHPQSSPPSLPSRGPREKSVSVKQQETSEGYFWLSILPSSSSESEGAINSFPRDVSFKVREEGT